MAETQRRGPRKRWALLVLAVCVGIGYAAYKSGQSHPQAGGIHFNGKNGRAAFAVFAFCVGGAPMALLALFARGRATPSSSSSSRGRTVSSSPKNGRTRSTGTGTGTGYAYSARGGRK